MQVTNPVSPLTAAAPVAAARPTDNAKNAFASLLRQSRSAQAAPPDAPAQGADAAGAAETTDAPAAPNAPPKTRMKAADKPGPQRPAERGPKGANAPEPRPETGPEEQAGNPRAHRSDMPVADPAAAPWLASAHQPLPAELTSARRQGETAASAEPTDDAVAGAKTDDTPALRDKAIGDAQARLGSATASQQTLAPWAAGSTRADSAAGQGLGQAPGEDSRSLMLVTTDNTAPTATALGAAAFNPLLGAARESAAPLAVNLPTPLASPEFAQALGVQISVLAADGVQRAELQLNPAEMGPVSVQIVIEGTSARVDFGADLAATRHAIEAGLPELAGALRDAGFTLTGGGVSQHSGGRHASPDTPGDTGPRRDADAGDATPCALPQRRAMAAGGVDLYA